MKIRFTKLAVADLRRIRIYIAQENAGAAATMLQRIDRAIQTLKTFPELGRVGRIPGTRELVIARSPFITAYRLNGEFVDILAIIHGRRAWPKSF